MNNEIIFKRCLQANKTPVNKHFFFYNFGSYYSVFERFSFSLPRCLFLLYYLSFLLDLFFGLIKLARSTDGPKQGP